MAEKIRQAHPDDERTPEQWAQFRQAESANQEDQTRRIRKEQGGNTTLEVNPSKHGQKATDVGGPQNG